MTLVLLTWLWTTGAGALVLLVLMGVQRVLIGPASGRRGEQPALLAGVDRPVRPDLRAPQAA